MSGNVSVEAALEVLRPRLQSTPKVYERPDHIREAHRAWEDDFTSRGEMVDRMFVADALAAAEVAQDSIYREMVMEVRRILLSPITDGRDSNKPHNYYGSIPFGAALADGWGEEDVIRLLAAVGIDWDGRGPFPDQVGAV